jgi:Tho complex subunit 7
MRAADSARAPMNLRVAAQVWDNTTAVSVLDQAAVLAARVTQHVDALTSVELDEAVAKLRGLLLRIELAAAAAAATSSAHRADRAALVRVEKEFSARSAQAREDIEALRAEVAAEQLARERRMQYNALAKVIAKEQPRHVSEKVIDGERAAIARLDAQAREIELKKTAARMEFHLLLQCVSDLEVYATTNEVQPLAEDVDDDVAMGEATPS